jgi:hypothetical protein
VFHNKIFERQTATAQLFTDWLSLTKECIWWK